MKQKLRKGGEVAKPVVDSIKKKLDRLKEDDPILLFRFLHYCESQEQHPLPRPLQEQLKNRVLLSHDRKLHPSVRLIVLSAVEGNNPNNMQVVSPVAEKS